jgi:UDPglucose 6-dehydrogenase
MPGGDADAVLSAIGADSRVGKKYFRAGLGFAGPCYPRDNRAFSFFSKIYGVKNTFSKITDNINNYQKRQRIPNLLLSTLREKPFNCISILGTTYKEDVTIVEESPMLDIICQLAKAKVQVRIYDPAGMEDTKKALNRIHDLIYSDSIEDCLNGSSLCFIGTPWNEFKKLTLNDFLNTMGCDPTIFDVWGIYQGTDIATSPMIIYRKIGKSYFNR